jgi:peptidoglycan/LPS O-acetylase OafA/YrhL
MIDQPKRIHVQGIDTVRAVAALSVVFVHLLGPSMPGIAKYIFTGHPAVIAFFVVSGFCIHYPYRKNEFLAAPFLAGRFIRIIPPAAIAFVLAQSLGMWAYIIRLRVTSSGPSFARQSTTAYTR